MENKIEKKSKLVLAHEWVEENIFDTVGAAVEDTIDYARYAVGRVAKSLKRYDTKDVYAELHYRSQEHFASTNDDGTVRPIVLPETVWFHVGTKDTMETDANSYEMVTRKLGRLDDEPLTRKYIHAPLSNHGFPQKITYHDFKKVQNRLNMNKGNASPADLIGGGFTDYLTKAARDMYVDGVFKGSRPQHSQVIKDGMGK
jgi:hypothetical protein